MSDPKVIEPIAARGWPAAESSAIGAWRLYASRGCSGRINTCWQHGPPGRSTIEAIDAVEAWYAARGFPARFKIVETDAAGAALADLLARRGYRSHTPTLTMTGPLHGETDPQIRIDDEIGEAFCRVFGDGEFGDGCDAGERLEALARIPKPRGYALAEIDGAPAAVGTCAIEADWAGILGMRTLAGFRRLGLGRRVFRALAAYAIAAGASRGYLQVDADNAKAIALYESEGYASAYLYRYWQR
ncbi:MAG TPA: GNAT family N-acetyltransferase [Caulobacteraceae bacterium]|nr:GNAT family N-acetyltransferase [Caulobacteraceae bacterium]